MELSSYSGKKSQLGRRTNSSEDVFAIKSPLFDEKKNGPRSCPTNFQDKRAVSTIFLPNKRQSKPRGELIASKLLPTRDRIDNMLTYMHELQVSEASLQKQLMTTKRHTDEELNLLMSKLDELQRTMQNVERERQSTQARLKEKEKCIRKLAAKLKKAKATQPKRNTFVRKCGVPDDSLPSIAEEDAMDEDKKSPTVEQSRLTNVSKRVDSLVDISALPKKNDFASKAAIDDFHRSQLQLNEEITELASLSPRSLNRPLWDPWASGGTTPMENMPPVFTIAPTELYAKATVVSTDITKPVAMNVEDDELKSVLMSSSSASVKDTVMHNKQQHTPLVVTLEREEGAFAKSQWLASATNAGSSCSRLNQQPPRVMEAQIEDGQNTTKDSAITEFLSPNDSVLCIKPMPSICESSNELKGNCSAVLDDKAHSQINQQNFQSPKVAFPSSSSAVSPSTTIAKLCSTLTGQQAESNSVPKKIDLQDREGALGIMSPNVAQKTKVNSYPSCASLNTLVHAASHQNNDKAITGELEALLTDFFAEVDKKRVKMATVYGKRYAGRENRLFAELTKRYGAAKVAAMKTRYENSKHASTFRNSGGSENEDNNATKLSNKSDHAMISALQHQKSLQSPTPDSDVNGHVPYLPSDSHSSANVHTPSKDRRKEARRADSGLSPSGEDMTDLLNHASSQRYSVNTIPPSTNPTPSVLTSKTSRKSEDTLVKGIDGSPRMNISQSIQFSAPSSASSHQSGMQTSDATFPELYQRHDASEESNKDQTNKPSTSTFEGLLEDLYRHHQPDKINHASIIVKQYAGKEGELVKLLKRKYGALSVKRLEIKLEVLKQAHKARTGAKMACQKRSRFFITISFTFWLLALLGVSCIALFVSFVALDAWKCHAVGKVQHKSEVTDKCFLLKDNLENFTYERVADYMSRSYPDICYCSELKARQNALFENISLGNIEDLVRLAAFSPNFPGRSWIERLKEQNVMKPAADLLQSFRSFGWPALLDFRGISDDSEKISQSTKDVNNSVAHTLPLVNNRESNDYTLKQHAKTREIEIEAESDEQMADEIRAASGLDTLEESSIREHLFDKADVTAKKTSEEDILTEQQFVAIVEESVAFPSKANEYYDVKELVDVAEPDETLFLVKPDGFITTKAKVDDTKNDATRTHTQHDSDFSLLEKNGYVEGDGNKAASNIKAFGSVIAYCEVPDLAKMTIANLSYERNAAELTNVVENEVRQKSVSLSLPDTEVDVLEMAAEYTETLFSGSAKNSELLVIDKEEANKVKLDSDFLVDEPESVLHAADPTIVVGTDVNIEKIKEDHFKSDRIVYEKPLAIKNTEALIATIVPHINAESDEDNEEEKELRIMEELDNPGELLRMAERAAVAELLAMEI
ncbi:uncharacterized protein PHALS_07624 [Plasmopara halstedii]|uniref:Uncharacterized protein n=1 Tax=Plasmopara halstedii TaxID=4781 RepID=A0A0P1B4Z4_PLAHL|nr:uncharacterized protein PHALS_07624 [Plasmopara halstedii]CEG49887.1 hypothetical protein PHALS_07624 [Plasmopara halstedii]|eukprot:XP_024586256.1 hypothetical protein PHALS_07624 [Plasmopara halstedii]